MRAPLSSGIALLAKSASCICTMSCAVALAGMSYVSGKRKPSSDAPAGRPARNGSLKVPLRTSARYWSAVIPMPAAPTLAAI